MFHADKARGMPILTMPPPGERPGREHKRFNPALKVMVRREPGKRISQRIILVRAEARFKLGPEPDRSVKIAICHTGR